MLPKNQQAKLEEWLNQVPVLGFNSRCYDLNLVKEHFIKQLVDNAGTAKVAKNAKKIMYMSTSAWPFLDIINHLGPSRATTSGLRCTSAWKKKRVVQLAQQAGPPQTAQLPRVVLTPVAGVRPLA